MSESTQTRSFRGPDGADPPPESPESGHFRLVWGSGPRNRAQNQRNARLSRFSPSPGGKPVLASQNDDSGDSDPDFGFSSYFSTFRAKRGRKEVVFR